MEAVFILVGGGILCGMLIPIKIRRPRRYEAKRALREFIDWRRGWRISHHEDLMRFIGLRNTKLANDILNLDSIIELGDSAYEVKL